MAVGIALVLIGVTVTVWLSLDQRIVTRAGAGWIGLLGIACGLGVLAPYVAWLGSGWPPPRSASVLAALATVVATTGSVLLGLRHATHRLDPAPARHP
jgi:tetrahydromethanopterin S-methyltransferase subunit C